MTIRNDPRTYRAMSVPFVSTDAANVAVQAFFADVEVARRKHKIPDVAVLTESSIEIDGEETRGSAAFFLGNRGNRLPMLARHYGAERQSYEDNLARIEADARKPAKR